MRRWISWYDSHYSLLWIVLPAFLFLFYSLEFLYLDRIQAERPMEISGEFGKFLKKMIVMRDKRANAIQLFYDPVNQKWMKERGILMEMRWRMSWFTFVNIVLVVFSSDVIFVHY
jgi:hypothetical protein